MAEIKSFIGHFVQHLCLLTPKDIEHAPGLDFDALGTPSKVSIFSNIVTYSTGLKTIGNRNSLIK
jgi:hypothetical protein